MCAWPFKWNRGHCKQRLDTAGHEGRQKGVPSCGLASYIFMLTYFQICRTDDASFTESTTLFFFITQAQGPAGCNNPTVLYKLCGGPFVWVCLFLCVCVNVRVCACVCVSRSATQNECVCVCHRTCMSFPKGCVANVCCRL